MLKNSKVLVISCVHSIYFVEKKLKTKMMKIEDFLGDSRSVKNVKLNQNRRYHIKEKTNAFWLKALRRDNQFVIFTT